MCSLCGLVAVRCGFFLFLFFFFLCDVYHEYMPI